MVRRTKMLLTIILVLTISTTWVFYEPIIKDSLEASFKPSAEYISHLPIYIGGPVDFNKYATDGDGTPNDPWIIKDYLFSTDTSVGITIVGTTDSFIIRHCQFNDLDDSNPEVDGIFMSSVQRGIIEDCIFTNVRHGIIAFNGCWNITIQNNQIYHTSESGIRIKDSNTVMIYTNTVHDIGQSEPFFCEKGHGNGIWIENSPLSYIEDNIVYDVETGIWLMNGADNAEVLTNSVWGTSTAILSNSSNLVLITSNSIFDSGITNPNQVGIFIRDTDNAYIEYNTVIGCTLYGIMVASDCLGSQVHYNSFVHNNQGGTSQAMCSRTSHGISHNYWEEWTTPDEDHDDIVDIGYPIDGPSANYTTDPFPEVNPQTEIQYHFIGEVTLLHPNGGEVIGDRVTIEWTEVFDILDHPFTYNLYYSENAGLDWTPIVIGLTNTSYFWNTAEIPRGDNYLVNVTAFCSEGLKTTDISDDTFALVEDAVSPPTVLFPNGEESVFGIIEILWDESVDTWNHAISYSVYISSNNGSSWDVLASDLNVTSLILDTTTLSEGDLYLIRIVAECTEGIITEDQSDELFSVHQHSVSVPTVLYPNGNELINGSVTIQWTPSVGSFGHPILYAVDYSPDNGITWINIDAGLGEAVTSLFWNMTDLNPGNEYLVRVEARCSEGKRATDKSDNPFILQEHQLSVPAINYPYSGASLQGIIYIDWDESFDSWEYNVSYAIYYSNDGLSWSEVTTTESTSQILWDTSSIADGSYILKVVAKTSGGLTNEDITGYFNIQNQPTSFTQIVTTTQNATNISTSITTFTSGTIPTQGDGGAVIIIIGVGIAGVAIVLILIIWIRKKKA